MPLCSSGGSGGGTKGPAMVDKRNQELPCPHCDRVFKQVYSCASCCLQWHCCAQYVLPCWRGVPRKAIAAGTFWARHQLLEVPAFLFQSLLLQWGDEVSL